MSAIPNLLNDDGSASIATAIMMSHHGFRRDLRRFRAALADFNPARTQALSDEWKSFHLHLHGHHTAEDNGVFPNILSQAPTLEATVATLAADHRRIDPLLERGDAVFAELAARVPEARTIVAELIALLDRHLALEEAEVIPLLRPAKSFPPPATEAEADMYAEGFAWAMQGIAPDVLERVFTMLPEILLTRLPGAQAAFKARCDRTWGPLAIGASRTPIPSNNGVLNGHSDA
jgi:hypothetical protein